jgi:hypothetical protein
MELYRFAAAAVIDCRLNAFGIHTAFVSIGQ